MRKRLKSNDEVCHYWANQVQSEGHTENLFFEGRRIWSYGSHYLLGMIHDGITLINEDNYSPSTGQHKSKAKRALGYNNYIEVPYPDPDTEHRHIDNIDYLTEQYSLSLKKYQRARTYKDLHLTDAKKYAEDAKKYVEAFDLKLPIPSTEIDDNLLKEVEDAVKREAKRKREERKKEREELKGRIEEETLAFRSMGTIPSNKVLKHLGTDLARIKDDEVETSQRARVPIAHVKRLFLAIDNGLDVAGKSLGHYRVTSYDGKTLKIGCHKFNNSEIDNMRELLKGE